MFWSNISTLPRAMSSWRGAWLNTGTNLPSPWPYQGKPYNPHWAKFKPATLVIKIPSRTFPRNPTVVATERSESLILLPYALYPLYNEWRPRLLLTQLISNSKSLGCNHERGGCDRDKASKADLVYCPSPSLHHLLGPTFNIYFLRNEGQVKSKVIPGLH
jgi:hypothetical protein